MNAHLKLILFSLLCLALPTQVMAGSGENYLVIHLMQNAQGAKDSVYFALDESPDVTFDNSNLLITSKTYTLSIDNVDYIDFSDVSSQVSTGISSESSTATFSFSFNANVLEISGVNKGQFSGVYSLDGKKIALPVEFHGQEITLHFDSCPSGVYIIKNSIKSFKIVKK